MATSFSASCLATGVIVALAVASREAHAFGDCEALPPVTQSYGGNVDAALLQIKTSSSELPIPNGQAAVQQTAQTADGSCSLPPLAMIGKIVPQKGACLWTPHNATGEKDCVYDLIGTCDRFHHNGTACDFFGSLGNHQYVPASLELIAPAEGEIALTDEEKGLLSKAFSRCDSGPRYFSISQPPYATPESPLSLLAGGTSNMAEHFYGVVTEVATAYHLQDQNETDMKVIVDVGANIGLFSIVACKLFPKARILAFEPHPANYRFLKYNLAAAGCDHMVESFNTGLSKDGEPMKLYWHQSIGTSAYRASDSYVQMKTITPQQLWKIVSSDTVSFMKVDCEGCEYEVVPLIEKSRVQQLYCEVHGNTIKSETNVTSDVSSETMNAVEKMCREGNTFNYVVK